MKFNHLGLKSNKNHEVQGLRIEMEKHLELEVHEVSRGIKVLGFARGFGIEMEKKSIRI